MSIAKPPREDCLRIYDNYSIPDWVPDGIDWDDISDEDQKRIKDAYRFSGFRPSQYQVISGSIRALL